MDIADKDLLAETGTIVSQEAYQRIIVRVNTKLHYSQHKYNLLREESEGFAKLSALLLRFGSGGHQEERVSATVRPWA